LYTTITITIITTPTISTSNWLRMPCPTHAASLSIEEMRQGWGSPPYPSHLSPISDPSITGKGLIARLEHTHVHLYLDP
jgi:hypothetical protein